MNVTKISNATENRIQSEIARLEQLTAREMLSGRNDPERWSGVLLREAIRVMLSCGIGRCTIAAILREAANDVSHGRPLRGAP